MRKAATPHALKPVAKVPTFDLQVAIARPATEVFTLLADVQDAEPIPRRAAVRMVKEPTGPTVVGTRWHEAVRVAPGLWLHIESVVTDVERPVTLGMDFRALWFTGHLEYDIEATDTGSTLHQRETLRMRLALRWLAPLVERELRRHLLVRLDDIRALVEGS